jgi:DNA primase
MLTDKISHEHNAKEVSNGQIRMRCCFREKHPISGPGAGEESLFLTPEINAYHCFSCGSSGNLLSLLTTRLGVSFGDAMSEVTILPFKSKKSKKIKELDEIVDFRNPPQMFLDRGLFPQTLRHFKVGSYEDEFGLEVATIPMYLGKSLKAIKHRAPDKKDGSKRTWSTKGFDKEHYFYNYNEEVSEAILVEGEADVWRVFQHGDKNVFGLLGSKLSKWHIEILGRLDTLYIAADNDWAGYRLTEEVYQALKRRVPKILIVPYPASDPDKCYSRHNWKGAMLNATGYLEYTLAMAQHYGEEYLSLKNKVSKALRRRL